MGTLAHSKHIDLATECESESNVLQSIFTLIGALELNPQVSEVHVNLGNVLLKHNAFKEAAICYKRALEIGEKDTNTYYELEKSIISIDNCDIFLDFLKDYLAEQTALSARICFQVAQLLRKQGKYKNAIYFYIRAIENDPTFAAPYISLQFISTPPEQLDTLIACYKKVIELNPQNPLAWGNLGDIFTVKNDLLQATQCYQKSCYHQSIAANPKLAAREWKEKKQAAPDFIIAGVSKCGTSSLQIYMGHHSQILLPHKKEVDFFRKNFNRGLDWYLAHFPSITDSSDLLTGDATPTYFESVDAPRRIHDLFPDTKIIILLRNPVKRTISWHYHKVSRGAEKRSLEEAINSEIRELSKYTESDLERLDYDYKSNILGSLYVYKFKEWFKYFAKEQVLIIKSEDLYQNPQTIIEQVFQFLGIKNESISHYSKSNSGSYKPASQAVKQKLADFFKPHNAKLEAYLGRSFNWS